MSKSPARGYNMLDILDYNYAIGCYNRVAQIAKFLKIDLGASYVVINILNIKYVNFELSGWSGNTRACAMKFNAQNGPKYHDFRRFL